MSDLIKRSDAIKAVNKAKAEGMVECPTYYIGLIPSADRPQGEWIDKGNWMGIECSRCKCHSRYVTPFCPHCGAHMKVIEGERR